MSTVSYLTLDKKGRATLPEEVRENLGVGPGDFLLLDRTERGTYELVPAQLVPKEDLWHLNTEIRERLRQAEGEIKAGRSASAATAEEAQGLLDSWKKVKPARRRRRG